ncbi:MAG: serine/threonine-protein kinase, partial [Acidobacteriota bacterium]
MLHLVITLDDGTTLAGPLDGEPRLGSKDPGDENAGRRIGPYRIERLIARGGMGRVYLARREDDYEQRVALKLIDRGAGTLSQIDRFYRERQILAQLQHPGIARILDGGTTFDGTPFFVMEFVDGEHVDHYCDRRELGLRPRLELVQQICDLVQFSHRNLVIHQDLKPGNILVTADGAPKLLDFGIAELLHPGSESQSPRRGDRPLTPSYASPEQLLGEPVTTASDIYALGVLLYRLVGGRPPYRVAGLGAAQVATLVSTVEVPPPSSIAPKSERRRLVGDIDAIVLKAMAKRSEDRYGSADQLAEDLRRHLANLPIEARPAPWRQRLRKGLRRHRVGLAISSLLLAFALVTTVFWRKAVHREEIAEQARGLAVVSQVEAQRSQRQAVTIANFLEDLFKAGDPDAGSHSVQEILERGRQRLLSEFENDPETRGELLGTLGTVYNNLALYDEARELKEEALRTLAEADPSDRQTLAIATNNLGRLLYDLGDYPAAEKQFRDAQAMWQRLGDRDHSLLALGNLASVLTHSGRPEEALDVHRRMVEEQRHLFGPRDLRVGESLYRLAMLRRAMGMFDESAQLLHRVQGIFEEHLGPRHTRVAAVHSSLGRILHAHGDLAEARRRFELALELRLEILGEGHVHVANTRKNFAALLLDQGDTARAGELLEQALAVLRAKKPAGDWTVADGESLWGRYLVTQGRFDAAEPFLLGAYRTLQNAKGDDDIATVHARDRVL